MLSEKRNGNGARTSAYKCVLEVLPAGVIDELAGLEASVKDWNSGLSEIRLRCYGECQAVAFGRNIPLRSGVSPEVLRETFKRVCGMAIYAHRDSIKDGYIPMEYGVRVGVVGTAKHDGGCVVGISSPHSLVFRLPSGRCDFGVELAKQWHLLGRKSMLIIAPPGGGKTTALRSLAKLLGTGRGALRVVAVDERCEFVLEEYRSSYVDVIRGYARSRGVEMALRTVSPEIILVDEIASPCDADALRVAAGVGVPVIATAHAEHITDLRSRNYLWDLVSGDGSVFEQIATIRRTGGAFSCTVEKLKGDLCKV